MDRTIAFTAFGMLVTVSLLLIGVLKWRRAGAADKSIEASTLAFMPY